MSASSGILWGWQAVADYLNVSVDTARKLADRDNLPVNRDAGRMVQSTKTAIDNWATERALSGVPMSKINPRKATPDNATPVRFPSSK